MTAVLIGLVSAKGSPGVTTTALALGAAWPRLAVVVDADPAGGDIAAGLGRGTWPPDATLLELAARSRTVSPDVALRALVVRPIPEAPLVLGGLGSPHQAPTLPWAELTAGFRAVPDADILCDAGRHLTACHDELLAGCDRIAVVTRSTLPAVRATARLIEDLRATFETRPALIVVDGGHPYESLDIAAACTARLLGDLPHDPRSAAVWSEGASAPRNLDRAPLARAARRVARELTTRIIAQVTV